MRVVLDTNVLVSAILSPRNVPARIIELFEQQAFEVVITEEILLEYFVALQYEKVRKRHKLSTDKLFQYLQDLRSATIVVMPTTKLNVVSDPDDNKLFECALAGGAHFIVSGDLRVQAVKQFQEIVVLSPTQFLALLESIK